MHYCWHMSFPISVTFDFLMANTIQIIVNKYARDRKYSCNTLKVKRNQLSTSKASWNAQLRLV
jgi:hypothetical protein